MNTPLSFQLSVFNSQPSAFSLQQTFSRLPPSFPSRELKLVSRLLLVSEQVTQDFAVSAAHLQWTKALSSCTA
jgi:hypothetical protein